MVGTYESLQHISIIFEISVFEISVLEISQFNLISKFFNIYKDIKQEIRNSDIAYVFLVP